MTESRGEAVQALRCLRDLRVRTRLARSGHWFVLVVFGILTLGSTPFYIVTFSSLPVTTSMVPGMPPGCRRTGPPGVTCARMIDIPRAPLGGVLNPHNDFSGLSQWTTVYWAIAVIVGFAAVVAYYRHRAKVVGVQSRVWPAVVMGTGLLALVLLVNGGKPVRLLPDFWIRGTGALVIVALGIAMLAVLERSRPFAVFATGFMALALISCLYNDVNILQHLGLAGAFQGADDQVPNVLLPGLYLVLGGAGFWLSGHLRRRRDLSQ